MIKKLNKFSFTFSPRALLSVVPTVVLRNTRIFVFFRFSRINLGYRYLITILEKQENYINFRVLHTKVKLFNSFICKTIYSLLIKELIYVRQKLKETFNLLSQCLIHPPRQAGRFSETRL